MKRSTVWVAVVAFFAAATAVSVTAAPADPADADRRQSAKVAAALSSTGPLPRGTAARWAHMNAGAPLELTEAETTCLTAREPLLGCVDGRTAAQLLISSTFPWFHAGTATAAVTECLDTRWSNSATAYDTLAVALYDGAPLTAGIVEDLNVCVPPRVLAAALVEPTAPPVARCSADRFAATQNMGELVAAARDGDQERLGAAAAAEEQAFLTCESFPLGSVHGESLDTSLLDRYRLNVDSAANPTS